MNREDGTWLCACPMNVTHCNGPEKQESCHATSLGRPLGTMPLTTLRCGTSFALEEALFHFAQVTQE